MPLKWEIGGHPLNCHGTYIVDHVKIMENHGIVFLNFSGTLHVALGDLVSCQCNSLFGGACLILPLLASTFVIC